MVALIQASVLY